MKRRLLALLLAVLTLTMLTAAAFAEGETELGAYNLTGGLKVVDVESDGGFYAGADTFELNCTGLTGEYSLVLLLEGDNKVPTSSNIQYIDQLTVENDGTAKFTLRPKALTEGTYNVYISTTDKALKKVASFQYGTKPPYTLGDVDGLNGIDSTDALMVLQHIVGIRTLTGTQLLAADVDGVDGVTSTDALMILQYIVGSIKSFR